MNDLIIQIKADTDKAVKEIDNVTKAMGELDKEAGKINKGTGDEISNITKGFTGLSSTLTGLVAGFITLGTAVGAVNLGKLGAEVEQSEEAFNNAITKMGKDAELEFSKIKEASEGLIPEKNLQEAAVAAIGFGVSIENLSKLMDAARVKSREMGTSVEDAFYDLAKGVGSADKKMIESLGLTKKYAEEEYKLAKSLNKSTDQLTKQEKSMVAMSAVSRDAADNMKAFGDSALTSTEKFDKLTAATEDAKNKIAKELAPYISELAVTTAEWIDSLDDEAVKTFAGSLETLATTMGTVWEAAKKLNDVLAPDALFGAGATAASLFADGLKVIDIGTRRLTARIDLLTGGIKDLTDQEKDVKGLATAVDRFAGDSVTEYNALQDAIMDVYEANQKQLEQWNSKSPLVYAENIKKIKGYQADLLVTYEALSKKRPLKTMTEDAEDAGKAFKELADNVTGYDKKTLKELLKHGNNRVKDHEKTISKLEKQEENLTKDTLKLNEKLAKDLSAIDEERFKSNFDLDKRISELGDQGLDDYQKQAKNEIREAQLLSDAKIALKNKEYDKYKIYIEEYESLAIGSADTINKKYGNIKLSEEEAAKNKIKILREISGLEGQYYDQKEQDVQTINNLEVANNKLQMEATLQKLKVEKELLKLAHQIAVESGKTQSQFDSTALDEAIGKYGTLITKQSELNASPVVIKTDSTSLDESKGKIEEIKTLTINGITLPVNANTTAADFDIKKMITKAKGDEITMEVNPDFVDAEEEIKKFKKGESKDPIEVKFEADTKEVDKEKKDLKKPVDSEVKFKANAKEAEAKKQDLEKPTDTDVKFNPDTKAADAARKRIAQPITVPVYYKPMNSPPAGASPATTTAPMSTAATSSAGAATNSAIGTSYGTKMVVPTTQNDTKVDVYFNVDGAKIKAVMEKNTITNLENYLLRETGF